MAQRQIELRERRYVSRCEEFDRAGFGEAVRLVKNTQFFPGLAIEIFPAERRRRGRDGGGGLHLFGDASGKSAWRCGDIERDGLLRKRRIEPQIKRRLDIGVDRGLQLPYGDEWNVCLPSPVMMEKTVLRQHGRSALGIVFERKFSQDGRIDVVRAGFNTKAFLWEGRVHRLKIYGQPVIATLNARAYPVVLEPVYFRQNWSNLRENDVVGAFLAELVGPIRLRIEALPAARAQIFHTQFKQRQYAVYLDVEIDPELGSGESLLRINEDNV